MVFTRSLIASLAATSRGTSALVMRLSAGLSCTGTLKCFSSLAPAEVAIALTTFGPGGPSAAAAGMTSCPPHEGHGISRPASPESTESSWSQCRQLNMMSIRIPLLRLQSSGYEAPRPFGQKNLPSLGDVMNTVGRDKAILDNFQLVLLCVPARGGGANALRVSEG